MLKNRLQQAIDNENDGSICGDDDEAILAQEQ
jgi:hypothetical protein